MSIYYKERMIKQQQNEVGYKALCLKLKNTRLHFAWIIYTKSTQPLTQPRDL